MTKRVAWFTGEPSIKESFTPHKVYEVVREEATNFSVINDEGVQNFCLKQGCAHICHKDWVFADIVEEENVVESVEDAAQPVTTKQPKWSEWIKNTTGKCPEGLKRKQKIKLKRNDGDKFNISKPHDAAWYIDKGGVNITHYKVKLKDTSKDAPAKDSKDISKGKEKPKKWSDWLPNLTGNKPAELGEWQTVKVKWSDGGVFNDYASMIAWYISEDAPNITHYKVKLKDQDRAKQSKWTKNTGVCPVYGNIAVMMKFSDGTIDRTQAQEYSWDFGQTRKIVKWRLAD